MSMLILPQHDCRHKDGTTVPIVEFTKGHQPDDHPQVGQFPAHFQPISSPRPRSATPEKLRMSAPRLGLGSASEVEASYTLEGGYGTEALPDGTGAWLAHRAQADVPGSGPGGKH